MIYYINVVYKYTPHLYLTDNPCKRENVCSFVLFHRENERTNKRVVFKRLHMGSVGSDRFHGERLRGLRVTDPNLPTRTHRPYRTHKNPA